MEKVVLDMTETTEQKWIAGFWRRIGAFVIDAVVLSVIGFMLGSLFEEHFVHMGSTGRLIGFAIALAYFGTMNSKLFDGQTVGKKLLKLKVVDAQNETVSLGVSYFRYCILGLPFFLNGVYFNEDSLPEIVTYLLALMVFGGILSTIYLYLFNRVTRQSLHDICVKTFVVNADTQEQELGSVWKAHYFVVMALLVISVLSPVLMLSYFKGSDLLNEQSHKDMLHIRDRLLLLPEVNQARVMIRQSSFSSSDDETQTRKYLLIQAFLNIPKVEDEELALAIAASTHENYSKLEGVQAINVTLTYGYDIGIASLVNSHNHQFNMSENGEFR